MTSKRLTLAQLATLTRRSVDDIRATLIDAGMEVPESSDILRGRDRFRARRLLGLIHQDRLLVHSLAERAGLSDAEARSLLHARGILRKKRLKRIPARSLAHAKIVLGITKPKAPTTQVAASVESAKRPNQKEPKPPRKKKKRRIEKETWRTIGKIEDLNYLSASDVEAIHWILVKDFSTKKDPITPPGVRDHRLLGSAVFRPHTSNGGRLKYPTVSMSCAALLHALVQDHPFFNGNKRTALVSMLAMLDINGWVCTSNQDDLYDFVIALGAHSLIMGKAADNKPSADDEVVVAANWLQRNIRQIQKAERLLKFRELRRILTPYGCLLEHPKGVGNRINIHRNGLSIQVAYKNEGSEVARNTVHKIRRELRLDEQSGYDSDIFYGGKPRISQFINKYRRVLDRLAKV